MNWEDDANVLFHSQTTRNINFIFSAPNREIIMTLNTVVKKKIIVHIEEPLFSNMTLKNDKVVEAHHFSGDSHFVDSKPEHFKPSG